MWVRKMSLSIQKSFDAESPLAFMSHDYVVSRNPNMNSPRNTKPKIDIGWALPENAVRPHARDVKREPPRQKGEEEELVGEGMCVQGVSVAKTPYLSDAVPVPGLESSTRCPIPGQASGPWLGRGGVLDRASRFSKPKTGTGVEAHEDEIC